MNDWKKQYQRNIMAKRRKDKQEIQGKKIQDQCNDICNKLKEITDNKIKPEDLPY